MTKIKIINKHLIGYIRGNKEFVCVDIKAMNV